MNFVLSWNKYKVNYIDLQNGLISLVLETGEQATFLVKGTLNFYKDENGIGNTWTAFDKHSVQVELVPLLSDINQSNKNWSKQQVLEHYANAVFKACYLQGD